MSRKTTPPPKNEIDPLNAVGQISPLLLLTGILIGLVGFVAIVGFTILIFVRGGFGPFTLPQSDPILLNFSVPPISHWQAGGITAESEAGVRRYASEYDFEEGVYRMRSYRPESLFWTTAGLDLGAGTYAVEIAIDPGASKNNSGVGAGLILLLTGSDGEESFYLFEIDPAGFAWIGRCEAGCATATPLVGDGWFATSMVKSAAGEAHRLKVDVMPNEMIFYMNGVEIGSVAELENSGVGDVGFLIESGAEGHMSADFDNFSWQP